MTTIVYLVRHAAHALVNSTLCGRMPGVRLGAEGHGQARALAERFASEPVEAVYTSPLERARETAEPIAERLGRTPEPREGIGEIEFGEWTGRRFDDLASEPRWNAWNAARSMNRPPRGESMLEAQVRAVGEIERVRAAHPEGAAVLVSHGDVIKSVLLFALGLPLDACARIEIGPASISTLAIGEGGAKVLRLNEAVRA